MYVDGQYAFPKLVASLDLVPDPFAVIRLRAKKHHRHGRAFELLLDPFFYAARASFCLFELCIVIERLRFATWTNHPGIADLHDPSNITVIVKSNEYPTRQALKSTRLNPVTNAHLAIPHLTATHT